MPEKSRLGKAVNISPKLYASLIAWSKLICWFLAFLLYANILAYAGLFSLPMVVLGGIVLLLVMGTYKAFWYFFQKFLNAREDLLKTLFLVVWLLWFFLLLFYAPFPAFSGRDEGSYANAAIYLAKFGDIHFQLPLLSYLKEEGLAHQSLNFPGFVIKEENLTSQFSPAYYVFLGIFYIITRTVITFPLANGMLVLGGTTAFYLLLRLFFPRWVSFAGMLLIVFNFLFLWFPRFTLSENLAFFLFVNLILFLTLYRLSGDRNYMMPIILSVIIFSLTRPEGWWLLLASLFMLFFWRCKKSVVFYLSQLKKEAAVFIGGLLFSFYAVIDQLPVYKRLVRDWLEWPNTADSYQQLGKGSLDSGALKNILAALFPSWQRLWYFIKVEWVYGVLIFGIFALATIIIYFWTRQLNFFSSRERILIGVGALLGFPFFAAFISPQISPDHPWMLRRFLFVVLPLGIVAALMPGLNFIRKLPQNLNSPLAAIFMAALLIPSIPATGYFLTAGIDSGREEVLEQLGNYFKADDFVFLERSSSGDGWRMWAEPLSSIYGINAAYVYSPQNISEIKQVINDRFLKGQKSFVILPDQSYHFEHELAKNFSLTLDKEYQFQNTSLDLDREPEAVTFPLLEKREYTVKIYLLSPR